MDDLERIKIGDLGLARSYESLEEITKPIGTLCYISPEFFLMNENSKIDFKADMWSFGCVLFEMITQTRAFYDVDRQILIEKITQGKCIIPADVKPEYKEYLEK